MKTKTLIVLASLLGVCAFAAAQPADPPQEQPLPAPAADPAPPPAAQEPLTPPPEQEVPAPSPATTATPGDGLRLNFRGVPLDMVLNYLSEAAGFIIVLEAPVQGTVDVWSNQALTKEEAVDLLNTILYQKGYAAIRNDRTLTIVSRDEAKKRQIPVQSGGDPEEIPRSDEMITQIIPVRYANAMQMTKDLQPLLPTYANLTANESGNALVLTATQADVRRMAEIVQALDTSISSISTLRVFPLHFADAKELATSVKELFTPPQQNNNDRRSRFSSRFGGDRDGGNQPEGTGDSQALKVASRVVAVADERSNALVVSAPDELIPAIEQLVKEIDVSVADITELRVFPLVNSSPVEMAEILASLFPDESRTDNNQRSSGVRFGPAEFFRGRSRNNEPETSSRAKKQSRVVAVPDQRTSSIIVSAPGELMPQIAQMITEIDANSARKERVFVYPLANADPGEVERILTDLFNRTGTQTGRNRNTSEQDSALTNRRQTQNQGVTGNTGGFGNSGFGSGGVGTGGRSGQTFP